MHRDKKQCKETKRRHGGEKCLKNLLFNEEAKTNRQIQILDKHLFRND